jgi:hypothetical protein
MILLIGKRKDGTNVTLRGKYYTSIPKQSNSGQHRKAMGEIIKEYVEDMEGKEGKHEEIF